MKRFVIYVLVAALSFTIGLFARGFKTRWWDKPAEPLQVTLSENIEPANSWASFDHYTVTLKNVSNQTIRGFSLGMNCDCRSWDEDDQSYPEGTTYTNPNSDHVLRPGESMRWPIVADNYRHLPGVLVKADLVHFQDGTNWGPNRGRKDGYVR
jgi:hypothetical protein